MSISSCYKILRRRISSNAKNSVSSRIVRNRFIEFFQENNHNFVRSSSVVPFHDPTIPYINAGVCQFKPFLSGESEPPFRRVVNSQKCIRVSGRHNDLLEVGHDGHHHTFFEMLGNWSFNDYSKETACNLAWELLTTPPFSIDKNKLSVTYFGGAPSLSLPPDEETRDIWRKIGVPENRIFPGGLADNFWEMSRIGPCGPCTEIFIDRNKQAQEIKHPSQLTELWNIVFIQYDRQEDGSLTQLPAFNVDTGMGLERILAVLLNKNSNYDTDLFIPLFETIHKVAGVRMYEGKFGSNDVGGIDTAYRKLADHSRMLTVALADGVFPDFNPKLKRILRKALTIPEQYFRLKSGTDLLVELSKRVTESLGQAYPEIESNVDQVLTLIRHEAEVLKFQQKSCSKEWNRLLAIHPELSKVDVQSMIGITNAYNDTKKQLKKRQIAEGDFLPSDLVIRLFDIFGLDLEGAQDLGAVLGFKINLNEFNEELDEYKAKSKESTLASLKMSKLLSDDVLDKLQKFCPKTDDSYKYNYCKNDQKSVNYAFNHLNSKLLAVIKGNKIVFSANSTNVGDNENQNNAPSSSNLRSGEESLFIFDKTCFYSEAGGQESDKGYFVVESSDERKAKIIVSSVKNFHGFIVHRGRVEFEGAQDGDFTIKSPCAATLILDESHRLANMRNHTAVHILHALLNRSNSLVAQQASSVKSNSFTLDFSLYGSKLATKDLNLIEENFKQVIQSSLPVERRIIRGDEILSQNVKTLPGEVYPFESVMVIEIKDGNFLSKEACCGTHVLNTRDIEDFVITKFKTHARVYSITGVTGVETDIVKSNGDRLCRKMKNCEANMERIPSSASSTLTMINELEETLKDLESELKRNLFPISVDLEAQEFTSLKVERKLKYLKRHLFVEESAEEIRSLLNKEKDCKFFVHSISRRLPLDKPILTKIVDAVSPSQPITVVGFVDGLILVECRVPKEYISEEFNAKKWMGVVSAALDERGFARTGENPEEQFHFVKKVPGNLKPIVARVVEKATKKAEEAFNR